jgi:hypothetical protein
MEEPSPRRSRIVLAGALAAAIMVGGVGFMLGRSTGGTGQTVVEPPVPAAAPKPEPAPARGELDRADQIALASAAADASKAGVAPRSEVAEADGRRFELRLPFGCDGAAGPDSKAAMRWRYDSEDQALRIDVDPVAWTPVDWWTGDAAKGVETIEGFWIARPWTSSEACPAADGRPAAPAAEPAPAPAQTLALGQIYFADGDRGGRRNGEPYRTTFRVPEARLDTSQGFRLRVSGRISRARGLGPIRCRQADGADQRPICLVSVVLDEVAIDNPATGETLATWNVGGSDTPGN